MGPFDRLVKRISAARKVLPIFLVGVCCLVSTRLTQAAGCAHDETQVGPSLSHFDLLGRLGAIADGKSRTPAQEPCSGPSCSNRRGTPWVPATASTPFGGREWLHLASDFSLDQPSSIDRPVFICRFILESHSSSIFHPPRSLHV